MHYKRTTYDSLIIQTAIAGLLALLMILPAEQLLAAQCTMDLEARNQRTGDTCCPDSGERQDRSCDQDEQSRQSRQHDHCKHNGDDGHDPCQMCTDCSCAFVPSSGTDNPFDREAVHQQGQSDVSAPTRDISYTVEETITAPDPPGRPISRPVPIYLSNQVFLN